MGSRLKIAVVHYHLKSGGVTRVVENTLESFGDAGIAADFAILVGPPGESSQTEAVAEIPELGYSDSDATPNGEDLLSQLREKAEDLLGGPPDLWHIHNHSLGKNTALSRAVALLAESGDTLLLQIHDFAEDGRPGNYRQLSKDSGLLNQLYPIGPRVGYAVLNRRDYENLKMAGVPEERLFSLPNAIHAPEAASSEPFQDWIPQAGKFTDLILYPVRATRRKNFGEFLLWSMISRESLSFLGLKRPLFVNTLGPTNPDFEQTFREWKQFSSTLELPVRLALAEDIDQPFEKVVGASTAILTTSVAEGFGLGFLEPWLFGKPLVGRDLPEVTTDFQRHGIYYPSLYSRLEIPVEWIGGEEVLRCHLQPALEQTLEAYGRTSGQSQVDKALDAFIQEDQVDFGRLDETLQRKALQTLADEPRKRALVNPPQPGELASDLIIQENAERIRNNYSPEAYAKNLHSIYRELLENGNGDLQYLEPNDLLSPFLDPASFNLLRSL